MGTKISLIFLPATAQNRRAPSLAYHYHARQFLTAISDDTLASDYTIFLSAASMAIF